MDCSNKAESFFELFKDAIAIDTNGNAAVRVVLAEDTGDNFITCENKNITKDEIKKSLIVQDCNGMPAINLAVFPCP